MKIISNYQKICHHIAEIALACGRDPEEISLVCVTKNHAWEEVQPLYDIGHRDFAESRQQEFQVKLESAPKDACWHFIGSLQKNKIRKVIKYTSLIHSVDSFDLAAKISQCSCAMQLTTKILLQVNTSQEKTKRGMSVDGWKSVFDQLFDLPGISIEGAMTMAPFTNNEKIIQDSFSKARKFLEATPSWLKEKHPFSQLSMGMSHDYPLAIKEGATLLRLGSLFFA